MFYIREVTEFKGTGQNSEILKEGGRSCNTCQDRPILQIMSWNWVAYSVWVFGTFLTSDFETFSNSFIE